MTFDRTKILAEGGKYHGPENPLIEKGPLTVTSSRMVPVADHGTAPAYLKEDASLPKRMLIEGVFQREGVRNVNGREYPFGMFERLLNPNGSVGQRIAERAMIGHLEHPENGTTDLNKGAILIIEAWVEKDGTVMGRAIVYNTPEGLRIQEYISTGTKIGISSRGTGTVDAKGCVCEDYQLETWDMVYNPSTPGAHPGLKTESVNDEPSVRPPLVAEAKSDTIPAPASKDKPMSVSAQLAEMKQKALTFLALDARKLDEAGRAKLAADLLDLRVEVAEKFQGEKRVAEALKLLAALDEAKRIVETSSDVAGAVDAPAAPEGQVQTGVPGAGLDGVAPMLGIASPALPQGMEAGKAWEAFKSAAALVAANLGKIPQIQAAIEGAIKDEAPKVDESAKALLVEARDEIIKLTEANEAASAIITEMRSRSISLKELSEASKVAETKAVEALAELTRVDTAGEMKKAVEEACAKHPALAAFKDMLESAESPAAVAVKVADLLKRLAEAAPKAPKVEEAAPQAPAPVVKKSVAERIRKPSVDESSLPATGSKVESKKDAGVVDKSEIKESAGDRGLDALTKCMPKVQAIVEGRSAGIPG
jgi:hypothetical protein